MQTDFREERKWKLALAYELSLCVLEWHAAGSEEERIQLGICAKWRKPNPVEDYPLSDDDAMDTDPSGSPRLGGTVDGDDDDDDKRPRTDLAELGLSDDEQDDERKDQETVDDVLRPDNVLGDALEDAQQQPNAMQETSDDASRVMKEEEIDTSEALRLAAAQNNPTDESGEGVQNVDSVDAAKKEMPDSSNALKEVSDNPLMDAGAPADAEQKELWTAEQAKILRSSLSSLPANALFANMEDFVPLPSDDPSSDDLYGFPDLGMASVFPELQPFTMTDVPDGSGSSTDGKKKSDKKADKDDPNKRVEETTYNKVDPLTRLMVNKPVLVSALEPSRKWRKGEWIDIDESPVASDGDGTPQPVANSENSSGK